MGLALRLANPPEEERLRSTECDLPTLLLRSVLESSRSAGAVIHLQCSAIHGLPLQHLLGLLRSLDVDEVGVGKASRLSGAAVNGDADIEDVADVAEEVCYGRVSTQCLFRPRG